jgi:hypothetical protein
MILHINSLDHISSSMVRTITDIVHPRPKPSSQGKRTPRRNGKQAPTTEEALTKAKSKLSDSFHASKSTPRGPFSAAVSIAESTLNQTNYNNHFREDLPRDPLEIWKEILNNEYENTWNQSVANVKGKSVTPEENNSRGGY